MQALTVLEKCRKYDADRRRIEQLIGRRRDSMTMISPRLEPTGVKGAGGGDKFPAFAADIDDLERALQARADDYRAELAAACALLDTLPDKEGNVLYAYYIKRNKIGAIAQSLRYSESYVRSLKASGEERLTGVPETHVRAYFPRWYPATK